MGLTQKILLFTGALVAGLAALTAAFASSDAERLARESIRSGLDRGKGVWQTFQADRTAKLKLGVRVLGNDPAFKAAIQTGDPATVLDLLRERGEDIAADIFVATDAQGIVVARSDQRDASGQDFSGERLVARALEGEEAASVWRQGDRLFHAVAVPMRFGSELVGVLVAGYEVTPVLARQLRDLTHSEAAFLVDAHGRHPRVSATSLPDAGPLRALLARQTLSLGVDAARIPFEVDVGGDAHLALHLPLDAEAGGADGSLLLLRSMNAEMAPFRAFQRELALVSAAVLAIALGLAWIGARRITGPVRELLGLVEAVRAGSYTGVVRVSSSDEIGVLATAFERMREGIAAREERIRRMALLDPLTELPNRALFSDRLQQALEAARRSGGSLAVVLVDIDRFRDVNDSLGPAGGDSVLRTLAERLRAALRASDTVARYGADEFAVVLPTATPEMARRIGRHLLAAIANPIHVDGVAPLHLRGSAGLACFPAHGADDAALTRAAQAACEVARRTGSGFAVYDHAYEDTHRGDRLWLVEELRQAIDGGQLVLHYQPQVGIASGRVVGVEALVRWNHPGRGLVPPGEFVPLAEQTGLIRGLTRWALARALDDLASWRHGGLDVAMSLNLSARDLLAPDLPDAVARQLETSRVPAERLTLEITESTVMEDPARSLEVLKRLRETGLRLSVDDFGTGHSSLAYLKDLPVHELKVDQSFVKGLADDPRDAAIVRSTVELGHNLGLEVTAEGVESERSLDLLREVRCDLAQGYYVSRPQPADVVLAWMEAQGAGGAIR